MDQARSPLFRRFAPGAGALLTTTQAMKTTYEGCEPNAPRRKAAGERIRKYRKDDLVADMKRLLKGGWQSALPSAAA